ncbi:hypothetical protein GMRT_11922 [Giardia muris]|uniref:Uncharacterized protein n=1 Tax=Giardia muris TaxID=5742 RepID=A0A4Z1SRN5_GIAMU|nr:hypothetical protein GMRT_11922 [Giardia muris]|eukprot:TNJ28536.1 hypothetical protein GMRT_11922 [Giardia muris]
MHPKIFLRPGGVPGQYYSAHRLAPPPTALSLPPVESLRHFPPVYTSVSKPRPTASAQNYDSYTQQAMAESDRILQYYMQDAEAFRSKALAEMGLHHSSQNLYQPSHSFLVQSRHELSAPPATTEAAAGMLQRPSDHIPSHGEASDAIQTVVQYPPRSPPSDRSAIQAISAALPARSYYEAVAPIEASSSTISQVGNTEPQVPYVAKSAPLKEEMDDNLTVEEPKAVRTRTAETFDQLLHGKSKKKRAKSRSKRETDVILEVMERNAGLSQTYAEALHKLEVTANKERQLAQFAHFTTILNNERAQAEQQAAAQNMTMQLLLQRIAELEGALAIQGGQGLYSQVQSYPSSGPMTIPSFPSGGFTVPNTGPMHMSIPPITLDSMPPPVPDTESLPRSEQGTQAKLGNGLEHPQLSGLRAGMFTSRPPAPPSSLSPRRAQEAASPLVGVSMAKPMRIPPRPKTSGNTGNRRPSLGLVPSAMAQLQQSHSTLTIDHKEQSAQDASMNTSPIPSPIRLPTTILHTTTEHSPESRISPADKPLPTPVSDELWRASDSQDGDLAMGLQETPGVEDKTPSSPKDTPPSKKSSPDSLTNQEERRGPLKVRFENVSSSSGTSGSSVEKHPDGSSGEKENPLPNVLPEKEDVINGDDEVPTTTQQEPVVLPVTASPPQQLLLPFIPTVPEENLSESGPEERSELLDQMSLSILSRTISFTNSLSAAMKRSQQPGSAETRPTPRELRPSFGSAIEANPEDEVLHDDLWVDGQGPHLVQDDSRQKVDDRGRYQSSIGEPCDSDFDLPDELFGARDSSTILPTKSSAQRTFTEETTLEYRMTLPSGSDFGGHGLIPEQASNYSTDNIDGDLILNRVLEDIPSVQSRTLSADDIDSGIRLDPSIDLGHESITSDPATLAVFSLRRSAGIPKKPSSLSSTQGTQGLHGTHGTQAFSQFETPGPDLTFDAIITENALLPFGSYVTRKKEGKSSSSRTSSSDAFDVTGAQVQLASIHKEPPLDFEDLSLSEEKLISESRNPQPLSKMPTILSEKEPPHFQVDYDVDGFDYFDDVGGSLGFDAESLGFEDLEV